jgi:primosomal protein N' (replication factor Y) (superfamily II helicase)
MKALLSVHEDFASEAHLKFLHWLSEYYLTPAGIALKSSFFDEAVAVPVKARTSSKKTAHLADHRNVPDLLAGQVSPELVAYAIRAIKEKKYSALLYHAPDLGSEYACLLEILRQIGPQVRGIIVLAPEMGFITRFAPFMREIFGERFCVLHSKLTKKEKSETIKKITSGKCDAILGTRSAILAPLPEESFIAVLEEQSASYKEEEGLRYNARDLAVMKAFIGKTCVWLSSVCPSIESIFNVKKGKYKLLNSIAHQTAIKRPRVKIAAFKTRKQSDLSLSSDAITEARSLLQKHARVLFLAGRKGYSLIRCEDCGHIESCAKCLVPMIFYKSTGMLKCHHCGHERKESETCCECGGFAQKNFTAGTERVREDVERLLKSPSLLLEKTRITAGLQSAFAEKNPSLSDYVPFVIATSGTKKRTGESERYAAAILLNTDLLLARPDFRAHERAFQELIEVSQLIKPEGSILIQTKSPGTKVLKCLKYYDFETFYEMELSQRRELSYPPYAHMVLFSILSKKKEAIPSVAWQAMREIRDDVVTVLGPLDVPPPSKAYTHCLQIILKSADNKRLHTTAKYLLGKLEENKKFKLVVDVDPLKI